MREPEYIAGKGLACLRLGGLSYVWQTHDSKPANKGLFAFVYPYFDYWFVSGKMSQDKFPKKELPKHLQPKPRKFYVDGEILTKLEVPNAEDMLNGWLKTSAKELFAYLPRQFAKDIAFSRQIAREHKIKITFANPYSGSAFPRVSVDHYEVFIPYSSKIK